MLSIISARLKQRHRTIRYPDAPPVLPARFQGLPQLDQVKLAGSLDQVRAACPVGAITGEAGQVALDTGCCLFCGECVAAAPEGAIAFTRDHQLAARERSALLSGAGERPRRAALEAASRKLFGRSLKLRQVSAGGCNACEADCNVLNTVVFDLGRFGIQFVASPRHADGLLVTGPVSRNMELALRKTYDALPEPRLVIAVGACAIGGGPYRGHDETCSGASGVVPVDLFIPGCPPHPITILDGLLRALGKIADREGA